MPVTKTTLMMKVKFNSDHSLSKTPQNSKAFRYTSEIQLVALSTKSFLSHQKQFNEV